MKRVLVTGDIHGASRALRQCLERAHFNPAQDQLICLGDVADGWPDTREAIEILLGIPQLVYILGNHDWWTLRWMNTGVIDDLWYDQGGKATVDAYADGIPESHRLFLERAPLYHQYGRQVFVHAGIDPAFPIDDQDEQTLLWDRSLAAQALHAYPDGDGRNLTPYDDVFVGHTPIPYAHPVRSRGVWLMDTGAGWSGALSLMDIATGEAFVSDPVPSLYPGVAGRQRHVR